MLQLARRGLSFANVMSVIAVFIALGAGAYASLGKNSVGSRQIKTGAVRAPEIKDGAVRAPEIKDGAVAGTELAGDAVSAREVEDGSLNGSDIGEAAYFNFAANVGSVSGQICAKTFVTGLPNDARDHLVLTPSHADVTSYYLTYSAEWSDTPGEMVLTTCNVGTGTVDDEITHFNLLVIDAQ